MFAVKVWMNGFTYETRSGGHELMRAGIDDATRWGGKDFEDLTMFMGCRVSEGLGIVHVMTPNQCRPNEDGLWGNPIFICFSVGLTSPPLLFQLDSMVFSQYLQLALLRPFGKDLAHGEFTLLKVRLFTIVESNTLLLNEHYMGVCS